MRILHTSDWHLGKKLGNFSRHKEQEDIIQEIDQIAETHDVQAILISGDLFDTFNPPVEAIELFYRGLKQLSNHGRRAIIAIAGNHDSPDRIESPEALSRACGIFFCGFPDTVIHPMSLESGLTMNKSAPGFIEFSLPQCNEPLRIITVPYANDIRLKKFLGVENPELALSEVLYQQWKTLADKYCDDQGVNILMAHLLFMKDGSEIPEEPEEEKPMLYVGGAQAIATSGIPENIQYVALGHLHRKQTIDEKPCPVVYSGSPLAYSFGETDQNKFVQIIEVKAKGKASVQSVQLHSGMRLLRKRFENTEDAVVWLADHQDVYVELTVVSDTFLSAEDRKRLFDAHPFIISLIPELRSTSVTPEKDNQRIDLSRSITDLFEDFFMQKKQQKPGKDIMDLFKELLGKEELK